MFAQLPTGLQPLRTFLALLFFLQYSPSAVAAVVDFDSFTDGDILTTQISGLTFTNTTILSAGISLNEFEFPPRSGSNVASDNGGPVTITFVNPVLSFSGYFTYTTPLTIQAFDISSTLLGTATSAFTTNMALSGDFGSSPNELLALAFPNIASVVITGDSLGGSFTVDDFTYDTAIPEPSTTLLLLIAAGVLHLRRRQSHP